jgi:O-antigen/teichoic acid export membrane protein
MDVVMLGAMTDARTVGFYVLAGAMANASGLPLMGMSAALFPQMARQSMLRRRWLVISWAIGLLGLAFLAIASGTIIDQVVSSRYSEATKYVVALSLAQCVRGVTSVYNAFLAAHGEGQSLRNAGLVLAGSNLLLNFALIPPFGAYGAAWASFGALLANLAAHIIVYRRSLERRQLSDDN